MASDDRDPSAILRYFRAVLQAEAAASGGCEGVALPAPSAPVAPDLVRPTAQARYAVVALEGGTAEEVGVERLVTREAGGVFLALTADRVPLFEHWLSREYAKAWAKASGQTGAEQEALWLAGFPVLATARFGRRRLEAVVTVEIAELAPLDGAREAWRVPTWGERKAGQVGAPPEWLRLRTRKPGAVIAEGVAEPALRVDVNLLERELGLEGDASEALREALEGLGPADAAGQVRTLVEHLCALRGEEPPGEEVGLVEALCSALAPWVADRGAELRREALIYDGAAGAPTAQLQRELGELLAADEADLMGTPLGGYLLARPARLGQRGTLGLASPHALTEAQRTVAEASLQTPLLAVEGPPGTGKTHVLMALAAHTVVAAARAGVYGAGAGRGEAPQLVVTSTNNRAVDNVVDPLSRDWAAGRLPVALRTGSRIVQAGRTADELDRVLGWLAGQDGAGAEARHEAASARFDGMLREIEAVLAPVARGRAAAEEVRRLEAALAGCDDALRRAGPPGAAPPVAESRRWEALVATLAPLAEGLEDAYDRLDEDHGAWSAERLKRLWKKHVRAPLAAAQAKAAALGLAAPEVARPEPREGAEVWRETLFVLHGRLERLLDEVNERLRAVAAVRAHAELVARRAALTEQLRAARAKADALDACDEGALRREVATREHALFGAACDLREAWAALRREALERFVKKLRAGVGGRGGQVFAQLEGDERRLFAALFPVVGCTLLSIGNAFPLEPGAIDALVVDEAGQCPPSHVVTALYRAERATLVGDTHQLEPVFGLSAGEERRVRERVAPELRGRALERFRMAQPGGTSAQWAAEQVGPRLRLTDHFRCQPEIIAISDRLCDYGLTVHTPRRSLEALSPYLRAPVLALPVRGQQRRAGGSWCNDDEARRLVAMADYLLRAGLSPEQLGLLTPFRAQARLLAQHLRERRVPVESWDGTPDPTAGSGVTLGTVHRLQGGERDVVLLSTVASDPAALAFLDRRPNLVNVAASRARTHLVVIGHPDALEAGRTTRELLAAVAESGWLEPR